ncbi:MAG: HPr kinase/phosphatase C-terminal domain-containing protein [Alphaproteobacteria bacterium]|nr:HPr kinase/phosphatase C-terminal domain-containing protein [Alphaproteobacteria bacterium]
MNFHQKTILHGSAAALEVRGYAPAAVLLRGKSGTGKSDLALRLIAAGGMLVSDDQVVVERHQDKIMVSAPPAIHGLIEVRGVGLLKYPAAPPTQLRLVVDLVPREEVPRLPERESADILGIAIPLLKLHAFDASAPLKIFKAIELVHTPELLVG